MNDQVATPAEDSLHPKPVAYRSRGARHLYCVICARQETDTRPVAADEVRSDAECHFCGGGILAIASRTLAGVIVRYMTDPPFIPPAHYRRDDGVDCCVHTIPLSPGSCRECRELADNEEG
jgi:hypothetical protein